MRLTSREIVPSTPVVLRRAAPPSPSNNPAQLSKKPPFAAVLLLNARFLSASTLQASAQNAARDRGWTRLRNAAPGAPKRRACCLLQRCKAITSSR